MSEESEGGFLTRWSRRKAAARHPVPEPPALPDEATLDLPALDSLGADSDYTVFLARGVSQAVQAQALRIAWASDPAIADFRGMAEYAWDFNAPGYGDLAPGDDAAVWLSQIVRSGARTVATVLADASLTDTALSDVAVEPAAPSAGVVPTEPSAEAHPVALIAAEVRVPEMTAEPFIEHASFANIPTAVPVRRHGGAMPT